MAGVVRVGAAVPVDLLPEFAERGVDRLHLSGVEPHQSLLQSREVLLQVLLPQVLPFSSGPSSGRPMRSRW